MAAKKKTAKKKTVRKSAPKIAAPGSTPAPSANPMDGPIAPSNTGPSHG